MKLIRILSSFAVTAFCGHAAADLLTLEASQDTTIHESPTGTICSGSGTYCFAGVNSQGLKRRTLIQFDIAGALPAGATIHAVTLTWLVTRSGAGPIDMDLHALDQNWGEGSSFGNGSGQGQGAFPGSGDATWLHTFFSGSAWTTAGGDFNGTPSASASVNMATAVFSSAMMTAEVQSWLNTPSTNFGWILKAASEVPALTAKRFAAREYGVPGARPMLEIDFSPATPGITFCNSLPNSTGSEALLSVMGAANSSLVFTSSPMPDTTGQLFFGPMMLAGTTGLGDGLRCVGGSTTRILPLVTAGMMMQPASTAVFTISYTAPYASGLTGTQYFQCWFRSGLPTGTGSNSSSGLEITF